MTTSRSYTWGQMRVGNIGKVQEECWEAGDLLYRKVFEMPAHVVPSFIEARRRCIAMDMQDQGHPYVVRDSGGIH